MEKVEKKERQQREGKIQREEERVRAGVKAERALWAQQ